MAPRIGFLRARPVALAMVLLAAACTQKPSPTDGQVFVGRYADDVTYQPFLNTSADDVTPDATVCYPPGSLYCPDSGATLKVVVPGPGDAANQFAGGAFVGGYPRNLSGYDAVTFWARSVRAAPFVFGLGADQSDDPRYVALTSGTLSTSWTRYVLPIPLATRLSSEKGLFLVSAGADGSPATGYTFWLANIQYETLGSALTGPTSVMPATCVKKSVGDGAFAAFSSTGGIPLAFGASGASIRVDASARYFTFESTAPGVASVDPTGVVSVQGNGTAVISARLGGVDAAGPLTVKVGSAESCPALAVPTTVASTPTLPASRVISLFGSAYTARPVDSWHTSWSTCCSEYSTYAIPAAGGSHPVKKYALHPFNGVAISPDGSSANAIDASAMRWFHVDVWTPDGFAFDVRLVNDPTGFPSESTVRSLISQAGAWVSLEIPMSAFSNLGGTNKIGQMLFLVPDGTSATFYVDNVYFHD